jgi:uncharacterized membrane protein YphA (DoxX/SURF4 family)
MLRIVQQAGRAGAGIEAGVARFAARRDALVLRLSLGFVFLWFALPKFVPGLSAMDTLARDTITVLSAGVVTGDTARLLLALLETAIGVGLLSGRLPRLTLLALLFQMAGTLTPLALFPGQMWTAPFVLSLEGQFIAKNLVLIAAGITLAGRLRRTPAGQQDPPACPSPSSAAPASATAA